MKICVTRRQTPNAKPKICVSPNASQWNIGWVPTQNAGVGNVYFMFFVLISFALGSQREPSFQWNMGFTLRLQNLRNTPCHSPDYISLLSPILYPLNVGFVLVKCHVASSLLEVDTHRSYYLWCKQTWGS